MKNRPILQLLPAICLCFLLTIGSAKAQSTAPGQTLDYDDLKGLLLKHKSTAESMLRMKQFRFSTSKERPESIIYAYKKEGDSTQILVRIRKRDGLVSEIAWDQSRFTLGNLTHDAVYDGFVPVAGNSRYYNRFRRMTLLVNYNLAQDDVVPCQFRAVQ